MHIRNLAGVRALFNASKTICKRHLHITATIAKLSRQVVHALLNTVYGSVEHLVTEAIVNLIGLVHPRIQTATIAAIANAIIAPTIVTNQQEEKQNKPEEADGEDAAQETRSAAEASNLNPRYTFDTFVVGKTNQFAHSACVAVAESPGEAYNPLFIYGGAGLGKTHLMHSIGHYVLAHDPGKKVLYVTSEQFTKSTISNL